MNSNQHQLWRDCIKVAPFPEIEPLRQENALLIVEATIDLAALAVSIDNREKLALTRLLEAGTVRSPGFRELDTWRALLASFCFLVVPPYVLLQAAPTEGGAISD